MRKPLFRTAVLAIVCALVMAVTAVGADAGGRDHDQDDDRDRDHGHWHDDGHGHDKEVTLRSVRKATRQYRSLDQAIEDGYQLGYNGLVTGCVAHPTDGAMGYHYFNADLMDDPDVDPLRPEGLVYAPTRNGKLRLVAVEWVVPGEVWDASGRPGLPSVFDTDLHVLNPALGWHILHAWIYKHNPSGVWADWNPRVTCPAAP